MKRHLKLLGLGFITLAVLPGSFFILGFLLNVLEYKSNAFILFIALTTIVCYGLGVAVDKLKNKGV